MTRPTTRDIKLDTDQKLKLERIMELATGGDDIATLLIADGVGNDDHVTNSLIDFLDGFITGPNPTLMEMQFNQQLGTAMCKHFFEYLVRD